MYYLFCSAFVCVCVLFLFLFIIFFLGLIRTMDIYTYNVTTIIGNGNVTYATSVDGIGTNAILGPVTSMVAVNGTLYTVEFTTYAIRQINLATNNVTIFAGSNISSTLDGIGTNAGVTNKTNMHKHHLYT